MKKILLPIFIFAVLFASFAFNFWGASNFETFRDFQLDSESLTKQTVICEKVHRYSLHSGFLVSDLTGGILENCDLTKVYPYISQVGLQAKVLSFFAPPNPAELGKYFNLATIFFAAATAVVLTVFLVVVSYEFGTVATIAATFLLSFSPPLVNFARNLFWVIFLTLAPFVFAFTSYPFFKRRKKLWWFYSTLGVLVALKALNGYDHLSNVILSGFAPVLYFELREETPVKKMIWSFLKTIAAGVGGFLVAFLLHLSILANYFGSWAEGFRRIGERVAFRLWVNNDVFGPVLGNFRDTYPNVFAQLDYWLGFLGKSMEGLHSSLAAAMISFLHYLLAPVVNIPVFFKYPYDVLVGSGLSATLVIGIVLLWWGKSGRMHLPKLRALFGATVFSLLASLSLWVTNYGYMVHHPHINTIVFFIPFLLFGYTLIGVAICGLPEGRGLSRRKAHTRI